MRTAGRLGRSLAAKGEGGRSGGREQLETLPRLNAAIKEVLRLVPPVGGCFRRAIAPVQLGPYTIAAGRVIQVDISATHHDGQVFAEPEAFRPKRHLRGPAPGAAYIPLWPGAAGVPGQAPGGTGAAPTHAALTANAALLARAGSRPQLGHDPHPQAPQRRAGAGGGQAFSSLRPLRGLDSN